MPSKVVSHLNMIKANYKATEYAPVRYHCSVHPLARQLKFVFFFGGDVERRNGCIILYLKQISVTLYLK